MTPKSVLIYFLAMSSVIFEFYFGIVSGVGFFIQVILIAITVNLISRIFSRNSQVSFYNGLRTTILGILAILGVFLWIFMLFISYYNFFPGKISDITLSNGKQKVVFVGMSHIAVPAFYSEKQETLKTLSSKGYTFLVEGVRSGTDESHTRFNESLGIDFTQDLYPTIAAVAGLQVQSGGLLFDSIAEGQLKNVDMSMDEIAALIDTGATLLVNQTGSVDMVSELDFISELSRQERLFIGYVFRSLLNWSIVHMTDISELTLNTEKNIFDIILTKRNEKIISYVNSHPQENIVVVYGALHFSGIFESLKTYDKNWRIESYTSYTPYSE